MVTTATAASLGKGGGGGGSSSTSPYLQLPSRPPAYSPGRYRPGSGGSSGSGSGTWLPADPRSASTQSLTPSDADIEPGLGPGTASYPQASQRRRTLLLVYIHGFYGNAQSFRSFPAHVHGFLKTLLSETHVIHSKIYPRYKCYRAIEVARDNFSAWLEPHTSPTTDVVLVGHSMGGLLAAEIVLAPNNNPYLQHPFKHRILGTVSLDSPFLGLHPGIIVSGISSLFQPAASPPAVEYAAGPGTNSTTSFATTSTDGPGQSSSASSIIPETIFPPQRQPTDPFFNPPYFNDTPFREQPFLKRLINFATKHKSEGIFRAVGNHVTSHLEFASCLADYPGMSSRYNRLRALEEVDEILSVGQGHPRGAHARVRFVNYYTLSSGRPERPKSPKSPDSADLNSQASPRLSLDSTHSLRDSSDGSESEMRRPSVTPEQAGLKSESSIDARIHDHNPTLEKDEPNAGNTPRPSGSREVSSFGLQDLKISTESETDPSRASTTSTPQGSDTTDTADEVDSIAASSPPMIPPPPVPPVQPILPNPNDHADKESRKIAEKERKRLQKAYDKASKEHDKAIREREKLIQKAEKHAAKAQQQSQQQTQSEHRQSADPTPAASIGVDTRSRSNSNSSSSPPAPESNAANAAITASDTVVAEARALEAAKPKKKRKFCRLPSKHAGARDPTWVDIYIDGVDEVGAHCGLFFPGPHYDKLVGDVGSRILGWVQDDLTKRAILDMGS